MVKTEWKLGEAQDKAFQALTRHLTEPPVLCYRHFSKRFLLRTDTSKQGLGVVLCHEQESVDIRVVAYGSRALHMAEENYSTHKLDFLLSTGRHYGSQPSHVHVQTTAKVDAVGHRWMAGLGEYNFVVNYKHGELNCDADTLSRRPVEVQCSSVNALLNQDDFTTSTLIKEEKPQGYTQCHWT